MTAALAQYLPFAQRRARAARLRLFCFPHAGGGASAYRDWPARFAPAVDVQPVQLPGRETLVAEPALDDVEPLLDRIVPVLLAAADLPYALFGHSMGAVVATEVAARLQREGRPGPVLVAVSGRGGFHRVPDRPVEITDDDVVDLLARLDGTDPRVLADPELRELTLRTTRHDARLCANYRPTFERLAQPILAFGGRDDPSAEPGEMEAWAGRTTAWCRTVTYPGGHFFLRDHLAAIRRELVDAFVRLGLLERAAADA